MNGEDIEASHQTKAQTIDTAWRIHGALVDWTGKVDSKASFTLGIESAVLAGVLALSARGRLFYRVHGWWEHIFFVGGIGCLVLGVLLVALVVRPQLRKTKLEGEARGNFIYFGHLKDWDESKLTEALQSSDVLPVLSHQLVAMSKIAWTKHVCVKWSMTLAILGTALLGVAAAMIRY